MIKRIAVLMCAIVLMASCSSIRGERVEAGLSTVPEGSSLPSSDAAAGDSSSEPADVADLQEDDAADEDRPALEASPVSAPRETVELGDADASESFDFRARELYSGSMIEGSDLFGQGEVLVTFVQPGCDISADGGPTIAEAADLHPEAIYVIVHSGGDDEAYLQFAEEAELFQENMVHLSDHFGALSTRYGIEDYPTTLLIDADLRITSIIGVMDTQAHIEAVSAVVKPQV